LERILDGTAHGEQAAMKSSSPIRFSAGVKDSRGVAAIEFAIILPLLLLILFGIIEFSILLYDKAMITNASREGARAGSLYREEDPTQDYIKGIVDHYILNNLISLGCAGSTATVDVDPSVDLNGHKHIQVTVQYPYTFLILPNFLTAFFSGTMDGSITISATSVMRKENQDSVSS